VSCDNDHLTANGWEEASVLNTWRGTEDGCLTSDKVELGSCEDLDKNG
jgi:hypothetical protein